MKIAIKPIYLIVVFHLIFLSCSTSKKLFNSDEWKINNEFTAKTIRYKMVDDIVKSKVLVNKTLDETLDLLGDYDFIFDNNHIRYTLGFNPDSKSLLGLLNGYSVLDIELNNNIVVKVKKNSEYHYIKKNYNKSDWESFIEARFTMSENITKKKILIGKSMEEVIELLGEKECIIGEDFIKYYLGCVPRPICIDPDMLLILFNDGKVIAVTQYEA